MLQVNDLMENGFVRDTYEFIVSFVMQEGFSPTHREIAQALDTGTYNVSWALKELEKNGYIQRVKGKPRTIKLCHYRVVEAL